MGIPLDGVEVKLGAVEGVTISESEGELLVKAGTNTSLGYYNNNAATSELIVDGWFHTGDVVRRMPDGSFEFIGRINDRINLLGGEFVYPTPTEDVLKGVDGVIDVCVVGSNQKSLTALIVVDPDLLDGRVAQNGVFDDADLRRLLQRQIEEKFRKLREENSDILPISNFAIIAGDFEEYKTPTKKIRRFLIEDSGSIFRAIINNMY